MKRKTLFLLSILTISATLLSCCKSADSVDNSETIETTAIESEATEGTETVEETEIETTASSIVESESWPEYKETMDYYVDQGIVSETRAHMLNPDVYGTETAGKSTEDFPLGTGSPDATQYILRLKTTTTKGFKIQAFWYKETNTVTYVYCGEVSPYGGWFSDMDSMDALDEAFNHEKTLLDMTHQQKIDILGEPSMTPEEVIEYLSVNGMTP